MGIIVTIIRVYIFDVFEPIPGGEMPNVCTKG